MMAIIHIGKQSSDLAASCPCVSIICVYAVIQRCLGIYLEINLSFVPHILSFMHANCPKVWFCQTSPSWHVWWYICICLCWYLAYRMYLTLLLFLVCSALMLQKKGGGHIILHYHNIFNVRYWSHIHGVPEVTQSDFIHVVISGWM